MPQAIFDSFSSIYDFTINSGTITTILGWIIGLILLWILFTIFVDSWLFYKRSIFKNSIEWVLLEIFIPREVNKTPQAMEQFFMNLHGLRNAAGNFLEKYIDGEVTMWWSLELASFGGEVHFYIRTPKKHKKMVEAGLYAQYPNVEVVEVEDYMDKFPKDTREIYKNDFNVFGGEFILKKEDAYPITTYEKFELTKEELAIDPISALVEVLSNIQKEEKVFIQILIRPAGDEWQEEGKKLVDKLLGRKEKTSSSSGASGLMEWFRNLLWAPVAHPTWAGKGEEKTGTKEENQNVLAKLTPGERDTIKVVEESLSKPGFESLIRFIYYAPKSVFSTNFARRGILGALNQYASPQLNSFRGNPFVETRSRWIYFPYLFVPQRVEARKQRILYNYRNRKLPEESSWAKLSTSHPLNFNFKSKTYILNTAEVATVFHVPAEQVLTAPHIKRSESKKMGPPAGLPIFDESE